MRWPLVTKTARDWRGGTIGIALVAAAIGFFDILIYPEYEETLKDFGDVAWVQGFVGEAGSIATPAGFLSTEFFSWIPLLLITLAVIAATGTVAGDEGEGTLELVLAQPVRRRRILWEKAAGIIALVVVAALAGFPGIMAGKVFIDFDLSNWRIFQATVYMLPITFLFLGFALWAATWLPSRAAAASLTIGLLVIAYFINMIGASVDALAEVRKTSPFYWADPSRVLVRGFDVFRAGGLLAAAALFFALATWSFERRDISSGTREWSWRALFTRGQNGGRVGAEPRAAVGGGQPAVDSRQ